MVRPLVKLVRAFKYAILQIFSTGSGEELINKIYLNTHRPKIFKA